MYDRTKPFNELPLLPPSEEIINDVDILKKLVLASRALATVNSNVLRLPNPFMLVNTIALQEAKTSTEIENIFTTEDELYKAISDNLKEEKTDTATKEVLRYREAMWAGYQQLKTNEAVDLHLVTRIFQKIKNTTSTLRPPQAQVVIKRGQSDFRAGEIIYTPPRGESIVETLMDNLIDFLNHDEKYPIDALIKMCIAYYQFEAIHPFYDGNGRTGRILNLLYLVHKNLLIQPVLYLSKYIILNKEDYYHHLGAVTQRGAWKNWILFMLNAVENTSFLTSSLIDDIIKQMAETLAYGKIHIKWYTKEINEVLFTQPYCKPGNLASVLQKSSRTTLAKYMEELVAAKMLTRRREGKEVYYLNEDLMRILQG